MSKRSDSARSPGRSLVGALAGAAALVVFGGCSSSSPSASSSTTVSANPATLLASAAADARAKGWVHVVVFNHQGSRSATITQDSGPEQGQQDIELGGVTAKVILVGGNAYIQGNSQAITQYFGFSAADGPTLAGRWISLSPSDQGFSTVSAGVSLDSVLQEAGLTGNLTETARSVRHGQTVVGITGTASSPDSGSGKATLYVTAGANPLPVEFDTDSSQGSEQAVFSDWGKPASLSAPNGATPIDSIPG